jgi:hypothetical protein
MLYVRIGGHDLVELLHDSANFMPPSGTRLRARPLQKVPSHLGLTHFSRAKSMVMSGPEAY